jgi:RNA-binding protein
MNALTTKQKKHLRALAHDLKPVVYVGQQGLSEAVLKDIERALVDHELIKVRFVDYKEEKKQLSEKIAAHTGAALLGITGHLACYFRRSPQAGKHRIALPEEGGNKACLKQRRAPGSR